MTDKQKIKSYRDDLYNMRNTLIIISMTAKRMLDQCEEALKQEEINESLRRAKPKPNRVKK